MSAGARYPLALVVGLLFTALVLVAGGSIGWLVYADGRDIALATAEAEFGRIGRETQAGVARTFEPVVGHARILALQPVVGMQTMEQRLAALPLMRLAIDGRAPVAAIYVGYADGGFLLLRPVRDQAARRALAVPPDSAYVVQSIDFPEGRRREIFLAYDQELREIARRGIADGDYDPRARPWYRLAERVGVVELTEPYVFYLTGTPGLTLALRADARAVVGVDVTLGQVSEALAASRAYPGQRVVLFDRQGRVLAAGRPETARPRNVGGALALPHLADLGSPVLAGLRPVAMPSEERHDGARDWQTAVLPMPLRGMPTFLGIAVPHEELFAHAHAIRRQALLATILVLLLALPVAWWFARAVSRSMRALTREAERIQAFRFEPGATVRSRIGEVDRLATSVDAMRDTIRRFLDISGSLAAERSFDALLQRVATETAGVTGSAAGIVYLLARDGSRLEPAAQAPGAGGGTASPPDAIAITADDAVAACLGSGRPEVRLLGPDDRGGHAAFVDRLFPGRPVALSAFPLRNREGEAVGVLALFAPGERPPSAERVAFAQALSGSAAVAIDNQRLGEDRKALLEAFIRVIAGAIDAKSPYTGGHCQRVPEITFMLARAACDATDGPFADFSLSPEEWEAVQIASWLHDCGKVTTPEYVVDKATKLETIHDRIHEVRMRFEVLKRDAAIACWKAVAEGGDRAALAGELEARWRELDDEFAFVASCNVGGEYLDPTRIERLHAIAARTWQRTLDDRLGVSHEERRRRAAEPPRPLPAEERLLADKPEHIVGHAPGEGLDPENRWGFRMRVPGHRLNRGELHNLSVSRGTLTEEERYLINHHIVQTIVMLDELPFPAHLACVPEIAGGHHEKMDGTGYPRGLRRDQMSWAARMMAIADIFEALTAADRPYKEGKKLSEAVRIMGRMKREGHIDPDLFDLFLVAGVHRAYAERFLHPAQIDQVDVASYLGRD